MTKIGAYNMKKLSNERYLVTEQYLMARRKALTMPPAVIGAKLTADDQVYSVVVDMTMGPNMLCTMVCLLNGTANLYFNNGESVVGLAAKHSLVAQAARSLNVSVGQSLKLCQRTSVFDLPPVSSIHYVHLMTRKGVYKTTIDPLTINSSSDKMQQFIFFLYQKVMSEMRNAQIKDKAASQK
jgi:hypothetical protein